MFCTSCAAVNAPNRRRCAGCGSGLIAHPILTRPLGIQLPSSRLVRTLLYRLPFLLLLSLLIVAGIRYQHERDIRAASYAAAEIALAAGDYDTALRDFTRASGYRDADRRFGAERETLRPYRLAYMEGAAALEARRYQDAIAALAPVVAARQSSRRSRRTGTPPTSSPRPNSVMTLCCSPPSPPPSASGTGSPPSRR